MQLNYHFFKFLCPELQGLIQHMRVYECFSQHKDELIIGLSDGQKERYIRANLTPSQTCLSFPSEFKRSKKNNISLFKEIIDEEVNQVKVLEYERAFTINFLSGKVLLFKMHGTRSNILYYPNEQALPESLFRNELKEDAALSIEALRNPLSPTRERFTELGGNAARFMPTLGKLPRRWLKDQGYLEMSLEKKWLLMERLLDMLAHPLFSIIKDNDEYLLTLLPADEKLFQTDDPIEAANEYFRYAVVYQLFEKEKKKVIKDLEEKKKRTSAYLEKTSGKLTELELGASPAQLADIIMANLHQIPATSKEATVFDFYNNREIRLEMKPEISPQKHAENLYRKAKNRKIEVQQLQKNIREKENYLLEITGFLEEVKAIDNFKELKVFVKEKNLNNANKKGVQETIPYKSFSIDGFEVLVGKSAKANDELLRHYTWKEDLWLHARDIQGSHTILKFKSGQSFPSSTIERAAELAAYYSKNRNESLAAVVYTPCKFVRKVKGSAPGAVMVDKEKVIMVRPRGPLTTTSS